MGTNIGVFYPQNPQNFPPKSGFSTLNSNAAADLSAKYVIYVASCKEKSRLYRKYMGYKSRGVLPPKPPKLPPRIGFSMLNSKSNYVRTVRDRKMIPSANPTISRTANPTKVMSLTLD